MAAILPRNLLGRPLRAEARWASWQRARQAGVLSPNDVRREEGCPASTDATADSIYSLSSGTKAVLGKIEEPITLDLYFSKDASGLPIAYKNYAARVQEMLRQYVRAGHGKLTLKVVNPRPDTPDEEKATAAPAFQTVKV